MADLKSLGRNVGGLAWVALRSFLGTMLGLTLLGVALAVAAYWLMSQVHVAYGIVAAVVALVECLVAGVLLGSKRAFVMAILHGLQTLRLGRLGVRLIFDRLLGVAEGQEFGESGGVVTRTLEKMPLAQAETRLKQTVSDLLHAEPASGGMTGWMRRRLQAKLLGSVQIYTLARFRDEGARHGGVDLLKVRGDLEDRIDAALAKRLNRGINVLTALVLVGLPVQILATVYIHHGVDEIVGEPAA